MSHSTPLRVDVATLLSNADRDWRDACLITLSKLAGKESARLFGGEEALLCELPKEVGFAELRPHLSGAQLLDAVDSLAGVDRLKVGGLVLLALADEVFQPLIPENHPALWETNGLLAAFHDYLHGNIPAEGYIHAAFHYRSAYGTTFSSAGTDEAFQYLFEAMPSEGLDCAVAEGKWYLASHWESFGRHLASKGEGWQAIDFVDDELDSAEIDYEAADAVRAGILDGYRAALIDSALEAYEETLGELVDGVLTRFLRRRPISSVTQRW